MSISIALMSSIKGKNKGKTSWHKAVCCEALGSGLPVPSLWKSFLSRHKWFFAILELPLLIFGCESLSLHKFVTAWWKHLSRADATSASLTLWCGFRGLHYLCCQTNSAPLSPQLVYKLSPSLRDMVCSKRMQRCKRRLREHRVKKKRRINYASIKQKGM